MDRDEVEDMVSDKINSAISSSQNQLLTEMSKLISIEVTIKNLYLNYS